MTSNRPLQDWGKLAGDVPSAAAILDRFLHPAELITIAGRSYRLRNRSDNVEPTPEAPAGSGTPVRMPTGKKLSGNDTKRPAAGRSCELER